MNIFGTIPHQKTTLNQQPFNNNHSQNQRPSIGGSCQVYQTSGGGGAAQNSQKKPQPKSHTASVSSLNRSNRSANRSGNSSALATQQKAGGALGSLQPHTATLVECLNSIKSQRFFKKPPQDHMVAEKMISPPRKTFNYQSSQKEVKRVRTV